MADRFFDCIPYTLAQECPFPNDWSNPRNYSHDKHDPGGATMCGIIQREYDIWRKGHSLPTQDVRKMTQDEGYAIYRIGYWRPHCDTIPIGLDMQFFDTAVNMGTTEATKILQFSLNIRNDGDWGPQTSAAVASAQAKVEDVIGAFTSRRRQVYEMMSGFKYFGGDWLRRASEIGQTSLQMAKAKAA